MFFFFNPYNVRIAVILRERTVITLHISSPGACCSAVSEQAAIKIDQSDVARPGAPCARCREELLGRSSRPSSPTSRVPFAERTRVHKRTRVVVLLLCPAHGPFLLRLQQANPFLTPEVQGSSNSAGRITTCGRLLYLIAHSAHPHTLCICDI